MEAGQVTKGQKSYLTYSQGLGTHTSLLFISKTERGADKFV